MGAAEGLVSGEPERIGGRILDTCIAILLGAMALWGAVAIVRAIWIYLCILVAVIGLFALIGWIVSSRIRRW